MQSKNYPSLSLAVIVICSCIAATGTFPYGYNFSKHLGAFMSPTPIMLIGIFLGVTATLGNADWAFIHYYA